MEIKNTVKNPFMTTPDEQFVVGMSDLEFFNNRPSRLEEGAILFCRSGHITAGIDFSFVHVNNTILSQDLQSNPFIYAYYK